ncbi:MAG: type II toxin-antitoxin system HicB family antitoxin [Candidatus Aminicenantes bacterium]|nr:type II toxin-antitoxin system HicB family antitoxin [Candidatus Aminicenantes bacterium]
MDEYRFSVVIGGNGNGWVAVCPEFGDCEARGETYEEALANIREAIQVRIEDSLGDNEDIPQAETVNFTTLRLSL